MSISPRSGVGGFSISVYYKISNMLIFGAPTPLYSWWRWTYVLTDFFVQNSIPNNYLNLFDVKAGTDLPAAAVMQHETCIRVHVRGYNFHPKQPQTINKLRTNQRFKLRNKQARHWSDCICILSITPCNKSMNVNILSLCATNAPQLCSKSWFALWFGALPQFVLASHPYFMKIHGTMRVSCCITAVARKSVPALMCIFCTVEPQNESNFPFLYIIRFQTYRYFEPVTPLIREINICT